MQSFELQQARAGHTKVNIPDSITGDAAPTLAFTNDQLNKLGAFLVRLVRAFVLVNLIDFVVAALKAG